MMRDANPYVSAAAYEARMNAPEGVDEDRPTRGEIQDIEREAEAEDKAYHRMIGRLAERGELEAFLADRARRLPL